jgi:UDP-3-O-acyl-N-acetylglucosamine deacetylase
MTNEDGNSLKQNSSLDDEDIMNVLNIRQDDQEVKHKSLTEYLELGVQKQRPRT